jgi:GNAT superfamily N-acetyltransferase
MRIRKAQAEEAEEIRFLIMNAVSPHKDEDFSEEGWRRFQEPNSVRLISDRLQSPDYVTFVCQVDETLVGIISVKDCVKIDQLFVDPKHRRRGIAKALWKEAKQVCDSFNRTSEYWVKSSTTGVSTYESFGFLPAGPKRMENGICFYPMALSVQAEVDR